MFDLEYGAIDALGALFKIRTLNFQKRKPIQFTVYSSEKNWTLEALPVGFETIEVKAGKFKAVKVRLKTSAGQDFEQEGNMFLWIATDHPNRPLVKVEAELKFGSVDLQLHKLKVPKK